MNDYHLYEQRLEFCVKGGGNIICRCLSWSPLYLLPQSFPYQWLPSMCQQLLQPKAKSQSPCMILMVLCFSFGVM